MLLRLTIAAFVLVLLSMPVVQTAVALGIQESVLLVFLF